MPEKNIFIWNDVSNVPHPKKLRASSFNLDENRIFLHTEWDYFHGKKWNPKLVVDQ